MAITVYDALTERKKTAKIINFSDSASSSSSLVSLSSTTFRDSIRSLLSDYAVTEDYTVHGNTVSCIFLYSVETGAVFPLFAVEERISEGDLSHNLLCDVCRCVGWGHHYVTKRKYHLIIPTVDKWKEPLTRETIKASNHLMHGVIHCNGFGHLLCINTDGAFRYFSGDQIMHLWDRLCSTLHTRKISLDDISRKGSMDLRLLHGVAYGRPWFGKWDYMFSHGSFGIRKEQYSRAICILSSMEVDKIKEDFSGTRKERLIKMIINFYRESSKTPLVTLSELLQFMLAFASKAPVERTTAMSLVTISSHHVSNQYNSFDAMARGEDARWPAKRLSNAAQAVLKVFNERNNSVITRQELREAVRGSIGDTGLIDFLLKHIDKVLIGDQIVQRFTNPESRMLQFSLRKITPPALDREAKKRRKTQETDEWRSTTPGLDPYEDILYLYQNLFLTYPDTEVYSDASEVILNCKGFVKEWPLPSHQEQDTLTVSCQVLPNHEEVLRDFTRKLPPGELVMVPQNATIRELKSAAEKALRDTYFVMENFEVLEIKKKDLEKIDETTGVKSDGNKIMMTEFLVTGFGLDTGTELRYEGGFDDWTVECRCGARDDDGERMVACDACKVWHHTKCHSIEDDEAVPKVFLCNRCFGDSVRSKKRSVANR
ncbi:BnaA06g34630D [Brassica napus]|uniref:BnaA06g34630D protein n=1 Tax=Brassica napus TaxID=3708 RepID=A0A078FWZ8_BRANA|nr:BnaA06g34630D [Brassica napus]